MSDYLDFYTSLMTLMGSEHVCFSKQLYLDMHYLKERILNGRNDLTYNARTYDSLCSCAKRIAKVLKKRLPDSVHSRMVLGPKNSHVDVYIKFCVRYKL